MGKMISVIVPVYNCEEYLIKCVESILNQTYQDIEIILVNDGSKDRSGEMCDQLSKQYTNIKVVHQSNKGQACARNTGVRIASGEYIAFVDSDDWIKKDMYQTLYENMLKSDAQISCCGIERMLNDEHQSFFNDAINESIVFTCHEALKEILYNKRITCSPCDKLYKAEIIKNNPMKEGMIFEDFEVIPRWLSCCTKIVYTGEPLYCYRTMLQSTMTTFTKKRFDEVEASLMRIEFYKDNAPDLLPIVMKMHVAICLNVLSYTRNAENCKKERLLLAKDAITRINECGLKSLSSRYRIKGAALMIGLPFFDFLNSIYSEMRGRHD